MVSGRKANRFTTDRLGAHEIYKMDADGRNLVNLAPGPSEKGNARWSPDGRRIAFASDGDGNLEIYRVRAGQ